MNTGKYNPAVLLFLFLTLNLGFAASAGESTKPPEKVEPVNWSGDFTEGWKQFDQLINEQKDPTALALAEKMLAAARTQKNNEEWTRSLIRCTQLRISLRGYEIAVRFQKDQPWPEDLQGSSVLNLYYARTLNAYAVRYSYEIDKREKIESKGEVDLNAWTRNQIYEEAQKAFENIWKIRSQLGEMPKTQWSEYIDPNDYPPGIRSTLRDVVSYLWVEILGNTSGWSPAQLNEIYRLDLKKLVSGNVGEISLVNPAQHPLEKICFILADLESWHIQKKEREAALEARLEGYRQLHQHFVKAEDRKFIQSHLESYLKPLAGVPWWSEGMAQLAEFIKPADRRASIEWASEEPDALIRARQIAKGGAAAYPESVGGKHCLAIWKGIEAPEYSLEGMKNDNPQKKSILAIYKNLDKLFFRAYPIDLIHTLETSVYYELPGWCDELESPISKNSPAYQWEVDLPAAPDYREHKAFVTPPKIKPGAYMIVASARPGFPKEDNERHGIYMTVGDLVLVSREGAGGLEVTVLSGSTGRPVTGAEVMFYRKVDASGKRKKESKLSDKRGIVQFTIDWKADNYISHHILIARHGNHITYHSHEFENDLENQPPEYSAILFTDRSIYRPLQKIYWKAVLYKSSADAARFKTSPDHTLTVSLKDLNGQVVESKTVKTNSFGTASGEFIIPSGRALGQWHLEGSHGGWADARVEEYKRPTFEAKMLDPEEPLRLNQQARLKGEAKYYFGLTVSSGEVKWKVERTPVFPSWWSYCRWGDNIDIRFLLPQVVASGTESLKEDGTFSFTFLPEIDEKLERYKDITYQYSITADITDQGGETRSVNRSFRIGFVSVEASASLAKGFFAEDAPIKIFVHRASLDGVPMAGKGTWKIVTLKGPAETLLPAEQRPFIHKESQADKGYQTPDDLERERWRHSYNPESVLMQWEEGSLQESGAISHDDKGNGEISVRRLLPGAYRLLYETTDDFGTKSELRENFIVAASSMRLPLPAMLSIENPAVKVGGTARILVHSGFEGQFMVFEVYRDGKCIQRKEMLSGKGPSLIEVPITEKDRGGLGIGLALLRDNQFMQLEGHLYVPWDNKMLKVEFSTFRDRLRPGSNESWTVKVTGPAGKDSAVSAAELLAYMYDRSLDAIVPHSPQNPFSLLPSWEQSIQANTNLVEADTFHLKDEGFNRGPAAPILKGDGLLTEIRYGVGSTLSAIGISRDELGAPDAEYGRGVGQAMITTMRSSGVVHNPSIEKLINPDSNSSETPIELRRDFSETAFWHPHLLTGKDGSASFEFKVPDSVTSWNIWVHAITKDFQSGVIKREARSVKELMVRPVLPRFLREGDQAEIKVVVNNASDHEIKGALDFDIIDVETDQSILSKFGLSRTDASGKPFTAAKSDGTTLTFPINAPPNVGQVAFKVTATSGDFSDGELRPIPILPGRMHLMQSRFATLKDDAMRVMRFDDLARSDDPTRINEQMVVTLDAQLFYSVLSALPYLVNYPHECAEQTLNRFLSTGILSSLYQQYPAIERAAKEFSSQKTQFEQLDDADPNRKMALEETPWLQMAKGEKKEPKDLINVLDSRIAKVQRESALSKLRQMQNPYGAFPWFPGGKPSLYMTLYILNGFSKALEFRDEIPRDMVLRAWMGIHRHYLNDIVRDMTENDTGWEHVTFLNYVLSNYPDASWYKGTFTPEERKTMLDFSFKHWKEHSRYLKGYLALTLKRMGRPEDALLVWDSVMDSAKTAEDQGTFWAPEDRAWLWYNDTIENHAFAIRTDMELNPQDPKLDGMVRWLFLNKKMNHWKSTRATAEAIYSLAHYLKKTGQLGVREDAAVTVGNQKTSFVFEPDQYTGKKNQIVIPGEKIDPKTSTITVEKTSKGHLFASATWHFSTEQLPEAERGDYLKLSRSYFKRVNTGKEFVLQPLREGAALAPGDEVEVHLSLTSKHPMEYVHLRDPRAAGFEPSSNISKHKWDLGISWYEEIRDSGTNFFFEHLPQGKYTFKYRIRAATAGTFKVTPATVQPMYAPEFSAYSSGASITISGQ
jgi:alpha-2-macroglobulin